MARKTVLALLALAATGLAAPAKQDQQAEPKRMPGNDEWYRPAQGFESAPLGAILKYRETKGISLDNKKSVKVAGSWQFLFRTQDSIGAPEATVVTVAVPFNADKKKLFLYHWFAVSCGPWDARARLTVIGCVVPGVSWSMCTVDGV